MYSKMLWVEVLIVAMCCKRRSMYVRNIAYIDALTKGLGVVILLRGNRGAQIVRVPTF
jgi:hypothetical protein